MSDARSGVFARLSRRELRRRREAAATRPATDPQDAPPAAPPSPAPATAAPLPPGADAATILVVCTGNICRSPMGELLLRARLGGLVRVHSAGTHALVDHGMTEPALRLAVRMGAAEPDAGAHRARLLAESMLAETDLVLTMTREHRSYVVQLLPSMLRRTFTLREFARLAEGMPDAEVAAAAASAGADPHARLQALARAVGERRGLVMGSPEDDDVIDPYRRSQDTYELSASQLSPAVDEAARVIRAALG